MSETKKFFRDNWKQICLVSSGVVGIGWALSRYKVALAHEMLVKTGIGIKDLKIAKKTFLWPFQTMTEIDLQPGNLNFDLKSMSKEKVEFKLPINITVGPAHEIEHLMKYAKLIHGKTPQETQDMISGIVEGTMRGMTSQLSVEEIFNTRQEFQQKVLELVETELIKLGMHLYNANIKEMEDLNAENKYFSFRKQRAIEGANYEAQSDVSEARKKGVIAVQERERDVAIAKAQMEAEVTDAENKRKIDIAWTTSKMQQESAEAKLAAQKKELEAEFEAEKYREQMMTQAEELRSNREIATLRASEFSKTQVEIEQKMKITEMEAAIIEKLAKARAEAKRIEAEAEANATKMVLEAKSIGLQQFKNIDPKLTQYYMGLENGLYTELAKIQASGFRDMGAKMFFNMNHGNQTNGTDNNVFTNPGKVIVDTAQSVIPMIQGLDHLGIKIPNFHEK